MSGFPKNTAHAESITSITKPVEITDIIVSQLTGLGEFTKTNTNAFSAEDRVMRMGDHLEFLAEIANKEHENANFEQKGMPPSPEMKGDALNNVTRLSLNEFSLYTKDTPLTEKEYIALLKRVTEIAKGCHENLHLVIASVPLLGPDKQVHNIVMHVQCGKQPELKCLAKFVPSSIDAVYPDTYNPSFIGKGVMPRFLGRKTSPDPSLNPISFTEINDGIKSAFKDIKNGVNQQDNSDAIEEWLEHTCNELAKIKDPNYLPPEALVNCATKLLNDLKLAPSFNAVRLLKADFKKFYNEMEAYETDSNLKYTQFRSAVKTPVNIISNAPDVVHVDDFGKFKMAATSKTFAEIVQAVGDCLSDPNKHSLALDWLNEIQRNLLPGNVVVNKAIDDLKKIINGGNLLDKSIDPRVAPARAFKDELDQAVGMLQKKPLTTAEFDHLNVFKAQYLGLLEDQRKILSDTQKLIINADVKPHFEKVFDKAMYINMANVFAADMESIVKNYKTDPEYYSGVLEIQKERLDALIVKHNITEPKVLALNNQLNVMLEKIELKQPIESSDFDLFSTNKSELDVALNTIRTQNTITEGDINKFKEAKEKMDKELNATILDGTVKGDVTVTDSLKQKVKDYQENDFTQATLNELTKLSAEWDANKAEPEFQQRVGRIQKILTNIHNALPDSEKNKFKPIFDKLSENKKVELSEIASLKLVLEVYPNKLNQLPYSTFPVGESHDIGYDPIVKCKTAGGVWFDTAVQVCLDHSFDTVQASMARNERRDAGAPSSPYVSHILTSNSMGLEAPRTFTQHVTHADRLGDKMGVVKINATKTNKTIEGAVAFSANPSTMKPAKSSIYTSTKVKNDVTTPAHLLIEDPPFGPKLCSIRKYPAHVLSPLPLNDGTKVSQDSFASSYYVSKIENRLMTLPVPAEAIKQKKCITDFSKALATLKNKPNPTVQDFYSCLDKFRKKIKKINNENITKMLENIHSMERYLDRTLLPPEPFISLRLLNSVEGNGLSVKQGNAVAKLKQELGIIQSSGNDLSDSTNAKDFAKKLFEFKKSIYAIDGEDIPKLTDACKAIELNIEKRYPLIHAELENLHKEHFKLGKSKLAEDYYQSHLDKINEKISANQKTVDEAKPNTFSFVKGKTSAGDLIIRVDKLLISSLTTEQFVIALQLKQRLASVSKKISQEADKDNMGDSLAKIAEDLSQLMIDISGNEKKEHSSLKEQIVQKRESIEKDERQVEQLKTQISGLQEDVLLKQEASVLSSQALEVEKNKLSQIQENKKEDEQALVKLREAHDGLNRDKDDKARAFQEEKNTQKEMQSQLQALQDKKGNLEVDNSRLLKLQDKLQNDKESLGDKLTINERQGLEIKEKIEKTTENLSSNNEKRDVALNSANKRIEVILALETKVKSLDRQCEQLTGEIADCNRQIKEYEENLKRLGPENTNNKEDILRNTNQLEDFKKRLDLFQKEYQKFDMSRMELKDQINSHTLERTALLSDVERLKEQNILLTDLIKSLESNRESNQAERQALLEQQLKVAEDISALHKEMESVGGELERNAIESSQFSSKLLGQQEKIKNAEVKLNLAESKLQDSHHSIEDAQGKLDKLIESEKMQLKTIESLGNRSVEQVKGVKIAEQKLIDNEDEILRLENELPNKRKELKVLTDKMESVDSKFRELENQKQRQEEQQKELNIKSAVADKTIKEDLKPKYEEVEKLHNQFGMK